MEAAEISSPGGCTAAAGNLRAAANPERSRRRAVIERARPTGKVVLAGAAGLLAVVVAGTALEIHFRGSHRTLEDICRAQGIRLEDANVRESDDPRLIYENRPGAPGINEDGFRGPSVGAEPPPGVRRVVMIGDSVVFGLGIDFPDTLGERLSERLGDSTEVCALGVPGYSTSQEIVLLEKLGLVLEPDCVVWVYCLNDPAHPVFHNSNGRMGSICYRPWSFTLLELRKRLFKLRERLRAGRERAEYHRMLQLVYADQIQCNLERVRDLCVSQGVPLLFAIMPVFEVDRRSAGGTPRTFAEYSLGDVHSRLLGWLADLDVATVDILNGFRPYRVGELRLEPGDPWHPNPEGNRIAAEVLAPAVDRILGAEGLGES